MHNDWLKPVKHSRSWVSDKGNSRRSPYFLQYLKKIHGTQSAFSKRHIYSNVGRCIADHYISDVLPKPLPGCENGCGQTPCNGPSYSKGKSANPNDLSLWFKTYESKTKETGILCSCPLVNDSY